jgi:hypothetical protein
MGRPATWIDKGKFSDVKPHGKDKAGKPAKLNAPVKLRTPEIRL